MRQAHFFHVSRVVAAGFAFLAASAADFRPPAGDRYALIGANGTILPGGRLLRPLGTQIQTGPGPHALAVSHNGTIATADTGPERYGITVIEPPGKYGWRERHIWARTPNSFAPEIADPDWKSVASGIAFDETGKSIWVSEGASGRVRQIDWNTGDTRKTISLNTSEWHGSVTGDLAFDNSRRLMYIVDQTNSRIAVIDGKSAKVVSSVPTGRNPGEVALSPDTLSAWVTTADSVCAIDMRDALKPEASGCVPAGSPGGIVAAADRVFVSNSRDDSIMVLNPHDHAVIAEVPLRIPSIEQYRGIRPAGMAWDPVTKWLLVAETGINAVGVVDTGKNLLIGHLPAGWMPTRIAISRDRVYVTNALGRGTGPTNRHVILDLGELPSLYHGTVTTFIMPDASEILGHTGTVFTNNGFVPWMHDSPKPPEAIKHVVLIRSEGRTFDEVLGDVAAAGNGKVQSFPRMARFGMHGYADGGRKRFSVQDAAITPNQHAVAQKWAFADNFYVNEDRAAEDLCPREFEGAADRVIAEIAAKPLPQFVCIDLRDDKSAEYPYEASLVEEKDLALGRILDYLSHSQWWPEMAVFFADENTQGGLDHVDSHRTVLLAAGPYVKRNYVSHTNSGFPSLRRAIFELLHAGPMNLADATAASLQDMFTATPDLTPFTALTPDRRIFDAAP